MTNKEKDKLKPCPFCGGEARLITTKEAPEAWVECNICGASSEFKPVEENAIKCWNSRAEIASEQNENLDILIQLAIDYEYCSIGDDNIIDHIECVHNCYECISEWVREGEKNEKRLDGK